MGNLIQMPRKTVETPKADIPADGAKILLFTGVRYERHDDAPKLAKSLNPVRARRRRA